MPRSKWHSTLKSNLATQGPKPTTTTINKIDQLEPEQQKQVQHTITITTSSEKSESIILMIQEPQQPEIIEIPLVNSMSTTVNSSSKNHLQNPNQSQKNQNQQNNKCPRTIIQTTPTNSKPRIFLLTRPSKPQLVRLETQTVQPHHQKTSATVTSQTHTKIIRIPFLPRSQVQTFSVKNNTNQVLKKDLKIVPQKTTVQYQNKSQVRQYSDHTPEELIQNPIRIQQVNTNQLSPTSVETSSNQLLQTKLESVKNTLAKSTVKNSLNLSENKKKITQSKTPLTLASMAGIELTGADMSLSQADMSGAMPPTATVEEINVPVFIDEYLQEVNASTTIPVTTDNIFNNNTTNNNSSSNSSSNISNNNHSNEKGNEVNNFWDTLENFEFDINLLTENSSKNKETALEVQVNQQHLQQPLQQYPQQHQQSLTEVDEDKKLKQHQLELQMMLDDILFNTKHNNNNNINNTTTTTTNCNNINNININEMAEHNNNNNEELFALAPGTDAMELELDEFYDNTFFSSPLETHEHAVDLNMINDDLSFKEIFNSSQPAEVMLSSYNSQSQSSQNLIKEIASAEPYINSNPTASYESQEMGMCEAFVDDDINTLFASEYNNDEANISVFKQTPVVANPLKRNSSQTSQHMLEKRLKLRLDTTTCRENILPQQSEITTPRVIEIIDQFNDDTMGQTVADTINSIYNDLISTSPQCASVKSEIIVDENTTDFSPPNTPYSFNSISNQTSFVNTAPSSPASSIATTSNASFTNKRGRGRPAKTHSDIPDRSQIQHLSESEQKKVLERAKNNEASRKSRLKHKERDNALEREEIELTNRNVELTNTLNEMREIEEKLKAALRHKLGQ